MVSGAELGSMRAYLLGTRDIVAGHRFGALPG